MSSSPLPGQLTPELIKYAQQAERKREYNRWHYENKVKPKRQMEKSELELLRERCALLETQTRTQEEYLQLAERYNDLLKLFDKSKEENASIKQVLEVSRQRNYELMIFKKDEILNTLH